MKYLFLGLICAGAYAAAPHLDAKLHEATLVGDCYATPGCKGTKLKWAATMQYCQNIGGHSIKYATGCVNF